MVTLAFVSDAAGQLLNVDPRIGYALVFGSHARGTAHAGSDLDIAIGGLDDAFTTKELGDLTSRLESATGQTVDLALLDEAPPGLAFRVFRDGKELVMHNRATFVARKARAILEYLDWKPMENLFTRRLRPETPNG